MVEECSICKRGTELFILLGNPHILGNSPRALSSDSSALSGRAIISHIGTSKLVTSRTELSRHLGDQSCRSRQSPHPGPYPNEGHRIIHSAGNLLKLRALSRTVRPSAVGRLSHIHHKKLKSFMRKQNILDFV